METRKTSISLAVFVTICFFLPWIQLSCMGLKDAVSGFDLARHDEHLLWLIPVFMLAVILFGSVRVIWEKMPAVFALVGTAGGGITAYMMYRERVSSDETGLLAAQMTVWFWLGLFASLGVVAASFAFYVARSRSP